MLERLIIMAGLFDRFGSGNNVSVHNFQAVLALRAEGEINDAQALTLINERLPESNPLAGAEITDANAILSALNGKATAIDKVRYYLKVNSANMLVEEGLSLATDSNWRGIVEI